VCENGTWRPRTNEETADLYKEPDIVTEIKRNRLRWIGHVERMEDSRSVKKIFKGKPEGRRGTGRPRKRYLDDVEDDLEQLGVRGWRRKASEREEWAKILKEAKALQGL
jgi:AAA+ ATPase superfamily predicted ATPase